MFDNIPAVASIKTSLVSVPQDPMSAYLAAPCEDTHGDLLGWWATRGLTLYGPRMLRMANSYLSAPGKLRCSNHFTA